MALADRLRTEPIAGLYSSPYPRALQTIEPLAAALAVPVTVVPDLRERLLHPGPLPDWLEHCRRGWGDFDLALPGGESSRTAQRRVGAALSLLAAQHPGETIAVASHGNLIALALDAQDPGVGFDFWRSMPMPAVYPVDLPA
jgi:2,3-bisphosphoglycerate-dependent phosphoglycerate mutase